MDEAPAERLCESRDSDAVAKREARQQHWPTMALAVETCGQRIQHAVRNQAPGDSCNWS